MNLARKITIAVVTAHALFIGSIAFNHKSVTKSQPLSISVNTLTYSPPPAPQQSVPVHKPPKSKPKKTKDVIRDLQKSIAKIDAKRDKPKVIKQSQPAPAKEKPSPPQYPILLSRALKEGLHLPEAGDVRLALTLNHRGKVIDMKILHSDSTINASYLKEAITQLQLPPFTRDIAHKKQHTFTLTFCHDQ